MLCRRTLIVFTVFLTLEVTDASFNDSSSGIRDLFNVTLLSRSSLIVDPGDNVTVKLNISSADGPVTIKVWNSKDQCTPAYVYKAIDETEIQLGRMWNTGLTITYRFEAISAENETLHHDEVLVNVTVKNVQGVESFEVGGCGTNVNISYSPHNSSLGLEHRIEILNEGINISVYPQSTMRHHQQFDSLIENSRFIAKITVCPRCRHPSSNRKSFRTTIADLSHVIRYFHIYKEYQTHNCMLIWSNDVPVSEYQLTAKYHDIVPSDSRKIYSRRTRLSSQQNHWLEPMIVGKNYTFTLSAKICGGIGQPVPSVGQCIYEEDDTSTVAPVQKSQYSAMSAILGALFGLSVLMNGIVIFLCIRRIRQIRGDMKQESKTGFESETRSKPYQTTYFEATAVGKDKYSDDQSRDSSDNGALKQNPPTYENTKTKSFANGTEMPSTNYENTWPTSSLPTFDGSASDGYVTPITNASLTVTDSVYQYENSSKSGDLKDEEYPEGDDDSFTSRDSDDVSNLAIQSRQALSPAKKQSPVPLLKLPTNLRNVAPATYQKTKTALTPGNSNAVWTTERTVKQGKAMKPPTSAKAFPIRSQNNELGNMPMKPTVVNLLPGLASKQRTNDQNFKVPLKPLKTSPEMNPDGRSNTPGNCEVTAALARLKPIGARK